MCGIAGFLRGRADRTAEDLARVADAMGAAIRHRGPDAAGTWVDAPTGIAMTARRLAIIDLSPNGAQPMRSASGRWVLCFNGEIYNFQELRERLTALGRQFRGGSDTEVLVEAIEAWGPLGALRAANGMFAVAAWDRTARTLYLARDRFGEKPLYYGTVDGTLLFGSELKALRAFGSPLPPIDRDALALYLARGYIPAPRSTRGSASCRRRP
jgi:asparagine synthase (glutamine-hydrolysing)